jgi:protein dithiol oxidoreductase (disulfide-forming)
MMKTAGIDMSKLVSTLVMALALASQAALAQTFQEGEHYQRIGNPASAPEDRVEVIEAFAYPCPACRNFHPFIKRWEERQPEFVDFRRMPVGLQQGWDLFARAYYTAEVLGIDEASHEAVFKALHDERRAIRNFNDIAAIYADFDVTVESFLSTAESFAVDSRMRRNRTELGRLGVRQTPTMIVQGKWRVIPSGFGSYEEMLAAIDYLVAREAEALGLGQAAEVAEAGAADAIDSR